MRMSLLIDALLFTTDELLDVDFQEDIAKLTRLADFLRLGLSSNDAAVISLSAKALGRLSKLDGSRTMAYEMCATELRTWLEVLAEKDRYEMKRQAAVTVLAQLASSAPSLFYLNLNRYTTARAYNLKIWIRINGNHCRFLELIWVALRDPKLTIRTVSNNIEHYHCGGVVSLIILFC